MDPAALAKSWAVVASSGDEVPLYFYSHLFLAHPELRELFPVSMTAQRDKLVAALGAVVSNATQLEQVTPFLEQLGRDHRRFSVVAEHYNAVGASLLATLQRFLGSEWTPQLAAEWAEAYGLVATVMVQAAEEAAETSPPSWPAEVLGVERRTMEISVIQVRPAEPLPYRPGQSIAMEIPQRPRRWRYYSPANAPRPDGLIEFHLQLVPGGQVSGAAVSQLRPGHTVNLAAAVGSGLDLSDLGAQHDLVMVAGGSGLAPLRAMLEQLDRGWSAAGEVPKVHLYHGARFPWNLYENEQLYRLSSRPWFSYTPVVSDDPSYPGRRGQVGEVAAQDRSWDQQIALVCGSSGMVQSTVVHLSRAGLPREHIRTEQFGAATIHEPGEADLGRV